MPTWKPIVGRSFQPEEFAAYCQSLQFGAWRPSLIVLHNTYIPNLAARPNGFSSGDMQGFVEYYRDEEHWSAGPHLFIDDHKIWAFTPLTTPGVHSPEWNAVSWGVEMLGDYSVDEFDSGRGLAVQNNAVAALSTLYATLGIQPNDDTFKLHKEDTITTHKNCPGKNVVKEEVMQAVIDQLPNDSLGDHMRLQRIA
ncbi:MAG: N-acetylmuramoyl-L-alanine amidase [Bacteroidetes bacterium]|nr:N-acetylmuramoyl-L-alanine amidase [Bacteroidota bacterium]